LKFKAFTTGQPGWLFAFSFSSSLFLRVFRLCNFYFTFVFFFVFDSRISQFLLNLSNQFVSTHTQRHYDTLTHTTSQLSVTHVFEILLYLVSAFFFLFFLAAFWGVTASTITCDNCSTRQQKAEMHYSKTKHSSSGRAKRSQVERKNNKKNNAIKYK